MNLLLSLFIILSPVWPLKLKPIEVPPSIQIELKLKSSLEGRYVFLTFEEIKELILFRDGALSGAKKLIACTALNMPYESQIRSLKVALKARADQILLLDDQVKILKSEVTGDNAQTLTVSSIILGAIVIGYIAYDIATD